MIMKRMINKWGKGFGSKLLKGNEEIVTLLLIYGIIILWVITINI
jgi:hypothetical protein